MSLIILIAGGAIVAYLLIGSARNQQLEDYARNQNAPYVSRSEVQIMDHNLDFQNKYRWKMAASKGLDLDRTVIRSGIYGIPRVGFDTKDGGSLFVYMDPKKYSVFLNKDNN